MTYVIDPVLPENFANTPNDERSREELNTWWDVPYIETWTAEKEEAFTRSHRFWLLKHFPNDPQVDVEVSVKENVKRFLESFPGGTRYTVHCLDGGAWDRPTMWGVFESLEQAKECCDAGPVWRRL